MPTITSVLVTCLRCRSRKTEYVRTEVGFEQTIIFVYNKSTYQNQISFFIALFLHKIIFVLVLIIFSSEEIIYIQLTTSCIYINLY